MTSIDENGGVNGNYGYVPAGTGVLLKVLRSRGRYAFRLLLYHR